MPSGYTHAVQSGEVTELEPFVLHIARGMGALVMMRDEPMNAPIPERFEPSQWSAERLAEAKAERKRLLALTDAEAQAEADAEHAAWAKDRDQRSAEHTEQRNRYQAMIAKVVQWQGAPEGIKEFALEQLHQSLDFDCREPFKYWMPEPSRDAAEWLQARLDKAAHDIGYHAREHAAEVERTEARNEWIAQLRASLANVQPEPPSPGGKDGGEARDG